MILTMRREERAHLKSVDGSFPCQPISFHCSDTIPCSSSSGKTSFQRPFRASYNAYEVATNYLYNTFTKQASMQKRKTLLNFEQSFKNTIPDAEESRCHMLHQCVSATSANTPPTKIN